MTESPIPIVRVAATEIRRMFNEGGYEERAARGELRIIVERSGTPDPAVGLPPGSRSETVMYVDLDGNELVRAHRYVRPDGSIAASGKADPKRIFQNGKLYLIEKRRG